MRTILTLLLFSISPVISHAWDPDDDTFDPSIQSVVADGASRIGDPSPFYREGYEERGFTYVAFTKPEEGETTVNLSLILPPDPDDPAKQLGGSIFLPIGAAEELAGKLEDGADLAEAFVILEESWNGKWTLDSAEGKLVIQQEYQGETVKFSLSIPAAKKLAGALRHAIEGAKEA